MEPDGIGRKLVAILVADAVGYSRLMGGDEEATLRTLTTHRQIFFQCIESHRGRVVNAPGDSLLAEFGSVVDAINCAIQTQQELAQRNGGLPENRRLQFRIGINLGDVMQDGNDLYGEGINIAARLESLSEPGGICLSGSVIDSIGGRLNLECEFLGEQNLKNIGQPVRAYRVRGPGGAGNDEGAIPMAECSPKGSPQEQALALPDKPSIAVLPFENMSGDPEQSYFSDGISEDLITDLARNPGLFVIASDSSFSFKNRPSGVREVGRELGVRYVLEGSVRKSEKRVRITAQLIEATTGMHLWAERYDRELEDIFALQDEIIKQIVTALEIQLVEGEQAHVRRDKVRNLEAYFTTLKAREHIYSFTESGSAQARKLLEKAITLDPEFALSHVALAYVYALEVRTGRSKLIQNSMEKSFELAKKALELDDELPLAHSLLAHLNLFSRRHDAAVEEAQRAVALLPNGADANAILADVLAYSGRAQEAINRIEQAMRLSPMYPDWYLSVLAHANFQTQNYEKAISVLTEYMRRHPPHVTPRAHLTVCYGALGRDGEARTQAEKILEDNPDFLLRPWSLRAIPYKNSADFDFYVGHLRKAGLK